MKIKIASTNIFHKDAIGNFCYDLLSVFEKNGYDATLYSNGKDNGSPVQPYENLFSECDPKDIVFYNHSIFDEKFERIAKLPCKKIIYFHGITPPAFLAQYQPDLALECEKGLKQLEFINHFDVLCVNSFSSYDQLLQHITPKLKPKVIPPIVSTRLISYTTKKQNEKENENEKKQLLCVGRVVPHKKVDDAIKLLSSFKKNYPAVPVVLNIVGAFPETGYYDEIQSLIDELDLRNDIHFAGWVDDDTLKSFYDNADAYIIMSEHEGFGVPIIEALQYHLPILAYEKNSIGEVLGESGCRINDKNHDKTAFFLNTLLTDKNYQKAILEKQQQQLKKLLSQCDESVFLSLIQ